MKANSYVNGILVSMSFENISRNSQAGLKPQMQMPRCVLMTCWYLAGADTAESQSKPSSWRVRDNPRQSMLYMVLGRPSQSEVDEQMSR